MKALSGLGPFEPSAPRERLARRLGRAMLHSMLLIGLWVAVAHAALALPACPADPFALVPPAERDQSLARPCGGEHLKFQVEPQDPANAARRTGVLRARLDSVASEPLWPGLIGTVKMSWAALGGEPTSGLRTERTLLTAGGLMRITDEWALQMNAGRDLTSSVSRATMGGTWRPMGLGMVFAEWMGDDRGGEGHRVGARWWLLPKRLSLEVDARVEVAPVEKQRYGLTLQLQP